MSPHSTPRSVKGILKSPITIPNSLNLGLSRGPNSLTVAFESADGAWFHRPWKMTCSFRYQIINVCVEKTITSSYSWL